MKHPRPRTAGLLVAALAAFLATPHSLRANDALEALHQHGYCLKHTIIGQDDKGGKSQPAPEKFARDRLIDLTHLRLEIRPDFEQRSIQGRATLEFSPISRALRELSLDAVDLEIEKIEGSPAIDDYQVTGEKLIVTFAKPVPAGVEARLEITYRATPRDGLYFRTPAMGYREGDTHLWTQGEPERHRNWFPGYDYPNERFTSEILCEVPMEMTVLSNGHLVSEKRDPKTGRKTVHWLQDKPHVNYLISLIAGHFKGLEAKHGELPIAFYTVPSDFKQAANSFRDTDDILTFFEKEIGVPYPWDKYYNVVVQDFIAGGMENTSITTLTDRTLFTDASENIYSSHRLDAHEAAHQWFGDLLTCKDWSHIWLNEGFASYYQALYEEEKFGADALRYEMYLSAQRVFKSDDGRPIVFRGYNHPWDQFDYRAYPKGAWVLHMLRSQLGESLYRRCIRVYVNRHRGGNVVTEDLNQVLEELSGRSLDRYFSQWVYGGGHPELEIKYAWDASRKQARIAVTQKQKLEGASAPFHFPLPLRFQTEEGPRDFTLEIDEPGEEFYCRLPGKPKTVRIDPDYTLLAEISFTPPPPLLDAQLRNEDDMMGRIFALKALAKKKDRATLDKIARVLEGDPFYGVRIEAAKSLATVHTQEALEALLASERQEDARVRREVVGAIGKFYRQEALASLRTTVANENNPALVADALTALGKFPSDEVAPELRRALERESYRNRIGDAAIRAMRAQDDPSYVAPILAELKEDEETFTKSGYGAALDALAYLARNEDDAEREPVRRFIATVLDHPNEKLRTEAIKALGTLEDPRSLALLAGFPTEPADRPENKAATAARAKLHGKKTQSREVNDLRKELLGLRKEVEDLQKGLETVKKKVDPEKEKEDEAKKED
ncbi:MAG: M1 family aminopeptidase [Verrucomicrobiales bacterium]